MFLSSLCALVRRKVLCDKRSCWTLSTSIAVSPNSDMATKKDAFASVAAFAERMQVTFAFLLRKF